MSIDKVVSNLQSALEYLKKERDRVEEQLATVQQLIDAGGTPAKRGPGRPKGSGRKQSAASGSSGAMSEAPAGRISVAAKRARNRPQWSPEDRETARDKMQKYWSDRKPAE